MSICHLTYHCDNVCLVEDTFIAFHFSYCLTYYFKVCKAGYYRAGSDCVMCTGNTIKMAVGNTANCDADPECDGIFDKPNANHTACGKSTAGKRN